MQAEQPYIDLYRQLTGTINETCGTLMNEPRDAAMAAFEKSGFPDPETEAYRHCDLREEFSYDYGLNLKRIHIPSNPHDVFSCDVPNLSTKLFFIINDQFYKGERNASLPEGVLCGSLNDYSRSHADLLKPYFTKLSAASSDGLVSLNTGFVQDGLVLYVPANVQIEKPIQIIQILQGPEDMMVQRRVLIIMEEGAQARVLFCDHTLSPNRFFSNQVTELFLGKGANLEYYELEMSHNRTTRVANTFVSQSEGSGLLMNGVTLNNGKTRNNINVTLNGEHAEANLSGIVLGEQSQFADNHILVKHIAPYCNSNQLFKYVLDDSAKGIFAGSIVVSKGAQKTNAYQSNKNLCSKNALMLAQPQLEIYADDVKCSHGTATGQMDENALFYIRSRGISETEARLLLKYAFTSDVIDKISLVPLRDRMRMLVEKRFRGELAKCAGCTADKCV
ncbi:MAG: Fe-S cluster assembly protein SufD [Bacteroidota bacterium]|nr:Fe-S cluster assembly protein SufD [Bacteroidota bacterium]